MFALICFSLCQLLRQKLNQLYSDNYDENSYWSTLIIYAALWWSLFIAVQKNRRSTSVLLLCSIFGNADHTGYFSISSGHNYYSNYPTMMMMISWVRPSRYTVVSQKIFLWKLKDEEWWDTHRMLLGLAMLKKRIKKCWFG